ncbi:putative endonuclease [Eubacterium ruminantium]|nr:putative endonuclease [Eubacterium ruminantium]
MMGFRVNNKRRLGNEKEKTAAEYLKAEGYRILNMNYSVRQAELDIVAEDESGTLVFVEVKYRSSGNSGISLEAVNITKQRKICRAALFYMNNYKINPEERNIRFDVVGIDGEEIRHIKNAFQFIT